MTRRRPPAWTRLAVATLAMVCTAGPARAIPSLQQTPSQQTPSQQTPSSQQSSSSTASPTSPAPSPAVASPAAPAPSDTPPQAAPDESGLPVSLRRIREGLSKEELVIHQPSEMPLYRTEVEAHIIKLKNYWVDDSTAVAGYVRTSLPRAHHEYLQNVWSPVGNTGRLPFEAVNNPVQFVTVPIFPVDLTSVIMAAAGAAEKLRAAREKRERATVKARIQAEVKAIEKANEKSEGKSAETADAPPPPPPGAASSSAVAPKTPPPPG